MNNRGICVNICTISGEEKYINEIDAKLNKNFSMESLMPISETDPDWIGQERVVNWGCEEDMSLITYITCNFISPQQIDMVYTTDVPNTVFLMNISKQYNLTINYSYNNEEEGYVGHYKIINGDITEDEYAEEEESLSEYNSLTQKYNFISNFEEEIEEQQVIISMKDILDITNKKH